MSWIDTKRMRRPRAGQGSALLQVSLALAASLLFSQPASAGEPLTLEAGLQMALEGNPSLKASEYATMAARENVRNARGRFLPRLDLTESFMRTTGPGEVFWTELSQERFSLGRFAASDPNDPDPISNYTTSVTLSQPLYAGGRIRTGYEISRLQREAAEQDQRRTRQEVIREFTAGFYGALLARRLVGVAETARRAVERHGAMAADLLAQGMVLRSDHLRSRVRLSEVEADQISARNGRRIAAANLNRIMAVEQGREFELRETPAEKDDAAGDLDALIKEAKESRPDLEKYRLMAETASRGVTMARAAFHPQVHLMAGYHRNDQDFLGDDGEYWTVMAVANLNLFDGLSSRARVRQAAAERHRAASLLAQAEQGVELEVRRAYHQIEEAEARLALAARAVAEAEESLRIVEDRYGAGMARMTELLDTESALTQARTGRARAEYDLSMARIDLALAVGRL